MVSLLPKPVLEELDARFGERFRALSDTERLALATALIEKQVTNERLRELTNVHSSDLTAMLRRLVASGFLERHGPNRGAYYELASTAAVAHPETIDLFVSGGPASHSNVLERTEGLNARQAKALAWVNERGAITTAEYKALVQVTPRTVTRDLNDLVDRGLLRRLQRGTYVKGHEGTSRRDMERHERAHGASGIDAPRLSHWPSSLPGPA